LIMTSGHCGNYTTLTDVTHFTLAGVHVGVITGSGRAHIPLDREAADILQELGVGGFGRRICAAGLGEAMNPPLNAVSELHAEAAAELGLELPRRKLVAPGEIDQDRERSALPSPTSQHLVEPANDLCRVSHLRHIREPESLRS
ncbi:MAG TPA: hypothetical protein PLL33_13680, partial [Paracoccus sp. (in: a-proteobacteria)]|nr:hypothetical protein [Paracoccus sp. (in: a-proteobacteria)]